MIFLAFIFRCFMTHSCCSKAIRSSIKLRLTTDERLTNNWRTTDRRLKDDWWEADVTYKRLKDDDWLAIDERLKCNWRKDGWRMSCWMWKPDGRLKYDWRTTVWRLMGDGWTTGEGTGGRLLRDWRTTFWDWWTTKPRLMDAWGRQMTD